MIFKTKEFARLSKRLGFSDHEIHALCNEIRRGLLGASLGGGLFKKRFASPGTGKRGGYRVLLCTRFEGRIFLLYVFTKRVRSNISAREQAALKKLCQVFVNLEDPDLKKLLDLGELIWVGNTDE
jgi:hypothetical protein